MCDVNWPNRLSLKEILVPIYKVYPTGADEYGRSGGYYFGLILLTSSFWLGYRAITAGILYRSVSAFEDESPSTLAGGETIAIEGR